MNAWDSDAVRSRYDSQTLGFLTNFNGKTRLQLTRVAMAFRQLVLQEGADPNDIQTLQKAREESRHVLSERIPFETLNWCCFTMMLSELGKKDELTDLLECADEKLQPTWENGGLYYPRNDKLVDDDWNLTHVEPLSGNSGIGYARLNIEDGQKIMWENPWTSSFLAERPWIDGPAFADDVDFLRGTWDEKANALIVTMRLWRGGPRRISVTARNLSAGRWAAYVNGACVGSMVLDGPGDFTGEVTLGEEDTDVIFQRVGKASE